MVCSRIQNNDTKKFELVICKQNYKKITFNHYIFGRKFCIDNVSYHLLYVDDIIIIGKNIYKIDKMEKKLGECNGTCVS